MTFDLSQFKYKANSLSLSCLDTDRPVSPTSRWKQSSSSRSISSVIMLIRFSLQSQLWIGYVCWWLAPLPSSAVSGIQYRAVNRQYKERMQSHQLPPHPHKACPCTCPEIRKSYWCLKYSWPISVKSDRGCIFLQYVLLSTLLHANDDSLDLKKIKNKIKRGGEE